MCKKKLSSIVNIATLGLVGGAEKAVKAPEVPVVPPSSATTTIPTEQAAEVQAAREDEKRRRAAAAGQSSTILTGSQGLTAPASTGQKTLLGA